MSLVEATAVIVALLAAGWDLATRRIPNRLTFAAAGAGLFFHLAQSGPGGLGSSAVGLLVGFFIFLPFFALGGMGGGDVKLAAALGAWLGPVAVLRAAIFGAVAGGVLAVAIALRHRYLQQALVNLWLLGCHWRTAGLTPAPALTLATAGGPRLAYAVPIAAGVMVNVWLH